jgi:hypothetical protein
MATTFPRSTLREFRQPGGAYFLSEVDRHQGNVLFVHSGTGTDSVGAGRSPDAPLATVEFAFANAMVVANQGDVIYVLPGHNEGASAAIFDADIAGVSVVGLGRGAQVPVFDFDHANATIDVGANGVQIRNIRLRPSVTAVAIGIDVEAGVTDTIIEDVEVLPGEDGAGVDEFVIAVDVKAGCTRTTIRRLKVRQHASAAGCDSGISLTGASDDVLIEDCDIVVTGAAAVAPIKGITTLSTNVRIRNCVLVSDNEPGIELLTGTTGVIADCSIFTNLATIAAAIVADGCAKFRNEYVEVGNERGALIGTASVDD